MRLIFLLDRAITNSEARRWLAGIPGVDTSVWRPAQVIYTATPLFEGLDDPVPRRSGFRGGAVVVVPKIREAPPPLQFEQRREFKPREASGDAARELLLDEGAKIKDAHIEAHGIGSATGDRALHLITQLGKLRTANDEVLSAEDIAVILAPEYLTPLADIERLLHGQATRGCRLIEAATIRNEADEALGMGEQWGTPPSISTLRPPANSFNRPWRLRSELQLST